MRLISRWTFRNLIIIKKSIYPCSTLMEPQKDIKFIDWKTDLYGDYPMIKSTFRSDRAWTAIKDIDETKDGQ